MSIILFAIIGATIHAGAWYWICYGIYTFIQLCVLIAKFVD